MGNSTTNELSRITMGKFVVCTVGILAGQILALVFWTNGPVFIGSCVLLRMSMVGAFKGFRYTIIGVAYTAGLGLFMGLGQLLIGDAVFYGVVYTTIIGVVVVVCLFVWLDIWLDVHK